MTFLSFDAICHDAIFADFIEGCQTMLFINESKTSPEPSLS